MNKKNAARLIGASHGITVMVSATFIKSHDIAIQTAAILTMLFFVACFLNERLP